MPNDLQRRRAVSPLKIKNKNLRTQRCADGFNSGVKGIQLLNAELLIKTSRSEPFKIKIPIKNMSPLTHPYILEKLSVQKPRVNTMPSRDLSQILRGGF
jgi:hypothetical protein